MEPVFGSDQWSEESALVHMKQELVAHGRAMGQSRTHPAHSVV